ncbi:FabD/lysophospholipase-like protein [Melanomma pulvis-pyrius CBS 109.77]|uniref:FabD/lysophospholipase-like protein n=1 Tax=Melanomma pulvis-pyrius CBS 109.77 TaxID=1314802 RepID=A0A6A6XPN2_9PLEO|nr:FabD/lysophospholipase-like protein [Melanomma pulvis-pyrius CBS 109.77]
MSWIQVEFSLVRYSAVEGTHYFFDPNYPTAVQFLLDGSWESWDVGYVRYKAHDPEIRRVAEDAEARLIRDESSRYRSWPHPPTQVLDPSHHANSYGTSPAADTQDLQLPDSMDEEPSAFEAQPHSHDLPQSPHPTSPQLHGPGRRSRARPYASPYSPGPSTLNANRPPYHISSLPSPPGRSPPAGNRPNQPAVTPLSPTFSQSYFIDPYLDASASPSSPLVLPGFRNSKIILSLDGDGVRGFSTILLVESLVNAVCSKIGRRADPFQIFDLLAGTSSGGILAIMLGRLRMRAHKAREAYTQITRAMFVEKWNFFVSIDPQAHLPPIDEEGLNNSIKSVITRANENFDDDFLDPRHDSTNVFVTTCQVDDTVNRPALIRTYPTRRVAGPEINAKLSIWQAMRATSAAPRYMTSNGAHNGRALLEPGLVDCGTGKNNPVRDLVFESRKLFGYSLDALVVVSIGTGTGMNRTEEVSDMANRVAERVVDGRMAEEKFFRENADHMARGWMKYFRFNVPDLGDVPLDEWAHVEKIKEKTHTYLGNPEVGERFYACVNAIAEILLGENPEIERWPKGPWTAR